MEPGGWNVDDNLVFQFCTAYGRLGGDFWEHGLVFSEGYSMYITKSEIGRTVCCIHPIFLVLSVILVAIFKNARENEE